MKQLSVHFYRDPNLAVGRPAYSSVKSETSTRNIKSSARLRAGAWQTILFTHVPAL